MFYTYICTNKRNDALYTGHTDDLAQRMEQHIHKVFSRFSAKYGCDKLVWFQEYATRDAAFKQERKIKAWKRIWKLERIETNNPNWLDIHQLPVWPPSSRGKTYDTKRMP